MFSFKSLFIFKITVQTIFLLILSSPSFLNMFSLMIFLLVMSIFPTCPHILQVLVWCQLLQTFCCSEFYRMPCKHVRHFSDSPLNSLQITSVLRVSFKNLGQIRHGYTFFKDLLNPIAKGCLFWGSHSLAINKVSNLAEQNSNLSKSCQLWEWCTFQFSGVLWLGFWRLPQSMQSLVSSNRSKVIPLKMS